MHSKLLSGEQPALVGKHLAMIQANVAAIKTGMKKKQRNGEGEVEYLQSKGTHQRKSPGWSREMWRLRSFREFRLFPQPCRGQLAFSM